MPYLIRQPRRSGLFDEIRSSWLSVRIIFLEDGRSIVTDISSGLLLVFFGVIASAITPTIVSGLIGPESFGVFAFLQSTLTLTCIFALLGVDGYALRMLPIYTETQKTQDAKKLILQGISYAFIIPSIFLTVVWYSSDLVSENSWHPLILILGATYSATYFLSFCLQGLRSHIFGAALRNPLIFALFTILASFAIKTLFPSPVILNDLLVVIAGCYCALTLISLHGVVKQFRACFESARSQLNALNESRAFLVLKSSLPMMVFSSTFFLMSQTDVIILGYLSDAVNIASYAFSSRLAIVSSIGLLAANILIPQLISRLSSKNETKKLQQLLLTMSAFSVAVYLLTVALVLLFSFKFAFIAGLGKTEWLPSLIVLLLGQFVNVSTGSCGYLLTMTGNQKVAANATFGAAIGNILLNLALIPIFGIVGAAIATSISISIANAYMAVCATRLTKVNPSLLAARRRQLNDPI